MNDELVLSWPYLESIFKWTLELSSIGDDCSLNFLQVSIMLFMRVLSPKS